MAFADNSSEQKRTTAHPEQRTQEHYQAIHFGEFLYSACKIIAADQLTDIEKQSQLELLAGKKKEMASTWIHGITDRLSSQKKLLDEQSGNKIIFLLDDFVHGKLSLALSQSKQSDIHDINEQINKTHYREIYPGLPVLVMPGILWNVVNKLQGSQTEGLALQGENISFIALPGNDAQMDWVQIEKEIPGFVERHGIKLRSREEVLIHETFHIFRAFLKQKGIIVTNKDLVFDRFQEELSAYLLGDRGNLHEISFASIDPKGLCVSDNSDDINKVVQFRNLTGQVLELAHEIHINGLELLKSITDASDFDSIINSLLNYAASIPAKRYEILRTLSKRTQYKWQHDGWQIDTTESMAATLFAEKIQLKSTATGDEAGIFFSQQTQDEYDFNGIKYAAAYYQVFAKEIMGRNVSRESLIATWLQYHEFCSYESGLALAQMECNNDMLLSTQLDDNWAKQYARNIIYQAIFSLATPESPKSIKFLTSVHNVMENADEIRASIRSNLSDWLLTIQSDWAPRWGNDEFLKRKQQLLKILDNSSDFNVSK